MIISILNSISLGTVLGVLLFLAALGFFVFFLISYVKSIKINPKFFLGGMVVTVLVMAVALLLIITMRREVPLFLAGEGTGLAASAIDSGDGSFTIRLSEDTIRVGQDSFTDPALLTDLLTEEMKNGDQPVLLVDDYASAKLVHAVTDVLTQAGVVWEYKREE